MFGYVRLASDLKMYVCSEVRVNISVIFLDSPFSIWFSMCVSPMVASVSRGRLNVSLLWSFPFEIGYMIDVAIRRLVIILLAIFLVLVCMSLLMLVLLLVCWIGILHTVV